MPRKNLKSTGPGSALKFVGAAAAAIIGGIAIGYLFGGTHSKAVEPAAPPTPTVSTLAPPVSPSTIHPHATNADYTAPGAPRIAIHEESAPVMRRVKPPVPPPADPEASQEAAPPVPPVKPHNPVPSTGDSGISPDDLSPPPATPDTDGGTIPAPSSGDTAPVSTPPAPAPTDPDFEHVNKPPDPQSGQADGNKAQYRVQTEAYTDESNARSVADQLRGEGFTTSTRSEQQGDRLIYKVQVGAYHSKTGAAKVAEDLQKKGYTAFVSPIAP